MLRCQAGKLEAQKLIGKVRESGRSLLTEAESKLLLKARCEPPFGTFGVCHTRGHVVVGFAQ